jgi:sporulation protein YlmC with PRC-barrel domain
MTSLKYTVAAIALFFTPALSYAEDATKTQPQTDAQKAIECPAAGTVSEDKLSVECKQQMGANSQAPDVTKNDDAAAATQAPDVTKTDDAAAATKTPAAGAADTMTTGSVNAAASDANSVLASQFIGQTVYSAANENVGEINDLVMSKDLDNIVAIIGVGGFLGIGEKDVAIPVSQLTATKDANNALKLTTAATKEQLEAAPAFDRTALN